MRRGIDMIGDADVCGITVIAVTTTRAESKGREYSNSSNYSNNRE